MRTKLFQAVRSLLIALLVVGLPAARVGAAAAGDASTMGAPLPETTPVAAAATAAVTCDFSNPGYSGWCRVTKRLRAGQRARGICRQVLTCLNDARCIQTYCNATTIRGGWRLEKVEGAATAPGTR